MSLLEELAALGADLEDALARFMDNSALYEKMLKKLPPMLEQVPVLEYIESGDMDTALSNAHTIKGVVGNLSLVPLHDAYTEIVDLFRDGDIDKAKEVLKGILGTQQDMVDCINKYI